MIKKILDKEFIKKQKESLLNLKKKLEEDLKKTDHFPTYGDTEEENAMEVEDFETYKSLSGDTRKNLREINKALKKIENGKYGICEVCKNLIEKARLKAFPSAFTCVEHSNYNKKNE